MRPPAENNKIELDPPAFIEKSQELATYLKAISQNDIKSILKISDKMAATTWELTQSWTDAPAHQRAAIDSFLGDIYSGLQIQNWSEFDRQYANQHLRILSGLYGILKPLDGMYPYRLEMGYRLPEAPYKKLYDFWGRDIVETIERNEIILDLSAVEYGKTITQYVEPSRVISPRFLTVSPKTGEPVFVVVHAKIARGAFASWMVRNKINSVADLKRFGELGYTYDESASTSSVPTFVCKEFGGIGLSVRLS